MALIDDLRKLYPDKSPDDIAARYAEKYGLDPEFANSELGYAPKGDFMRGVSNYLPQVNEMLGAGQALVGEGMRRGLGEGPVGNYLRDAGLERMKGAKADQDSRPTDSFSGAMDKGIGSVITDWLPYQMGQSVGNLAEMGAAMGVGSILGSAVPVGGTLTGAAAGLVGRKAVRAAVVAEAEKIAASQGVKAAEAYAVGQLGRNIGGQVGLGVAAGFHGVGEVGGRAIDENGLENVDFGRVLPAMAAHAGLEYLGDRIMGGALRGGQPLDLLMRSGPVNLAKTVGKGVVVGGAKEAPVEIAQTAAERFGAGLPLDNAAAGREYIDAGAAAFGMMAGPGTVGGVRTYMGSRYSPEQRNEAQAVLADPTADPQTRLQASEVLRRMELRDQPVDLLANRQDAQYQGYVSPLQEQAAQDNTQFDTRNQIEQQLAAQGTAGGAQGSGSLLTPRPSAAPTAAPAPIAPAGSIQLVNGVPTLVPAPAPAAAPAAPVIPRLTPDLSRATPRYSGSTLEFPDDVHKAAYIIGKETTKSKRDAEYLGFVMKALGVDESTARAYGRQVNAALKTVAPVDGRITVPTVQFTPAAQGAAASGQAAQVAPVESDAEKIQRLRMRPKPAGLVLDPTLPISIGAQWMLHDFTTEGPIAEKVYSWQEVAKENGVPATDFAATIAALQAKLGAPNGNNGQGVRTGGISDLKTQDGAGETAVGISGQAAQPPVAGTTGEGVEAEEAITKRLDVSLNSEAAPRRGNAPTVAGRKPLDEAGVQFVAKALRQKKSDKGVSSGPYARLHDALDRWDKAISGALRVGKEDLQNERFAALALATRGEAGSMNAVVPLLQAMEDEFGTDSVNKVVAAIKGYNEKVGGKEISPHIRLAASWNMYKKGTLTANEGVSAGSDTTVRDNLRTEAFARELADMGIDMGSALEQATQDVPEKQGEELGPLRRTEGGSKKNKARWVGERSGLMSFLSARAWQGFSADQRAIADLLYNFFDKTGNPPKIVFSKEEGKNSKGRRIYGNYDYNAHTITIYKGGHSIRTVLHEALHAATVKYLVDHWDNKNAVIGYLENTLVTMAKLHGKAWAEFSKDLDAGTKARIEVALRNTAELHQNSNGNSDAQRKAVAEFITYGQTDPDFQAYMRHLKIPKIESPFQLDKNSTVNFKSGKRITSSTAALTIWSRFTNAMSWITTGKAFNKEATSLMDQFLSDTGYLYKALFTEGDATAAPAAAAPTNKAAPAQAPPTKAAPAATPGIRARLKVGDLVTHRDSKRTAVVKTAEDGDGFVRVQYDDAAKEYGNTAPLTRLKAEYLVPEGFDAEAPAPDEEITGEPTVLRGNINSAVIVDMVGQQMYDNAKIAGLTAAKELFQNAVDALKGAIEKGLLKEGKVAITVDAADRTVEIKDNGVGMSFETVQKAFFTLGGTEKETERPSGGFGIAKIQFLSAASKIWLTTVRDGVKVVVETTGADVRRTMSAFGGDPENAKFPADQIKRFKTSDPNGTTVKVKMPETSTDDDGIVTKVEMPKDWTPTPAIEHSPVLENIEVTWNGTVLPIGKNFPKDQFVPLKTVIMPAWGEADILVSKEQVQYSSQKVVHVLSYGVWQFDTIIKPPGAGVWDPAIPYEVFINIRSKVKAQSPSYPIGRSREAFTAKGAKDMERVKSMIGAMFGFRETIKHVTDYGVLKVVRPDGRIEDSVSLVPEVSDAVKAEALLIPDNSNVTVVDGRLMIDGKSIPEMTKAEIEAYRPPDIGQFKIDQDLLNPNDQLLQEGLEYRVEDANGNETWVKPSVYGKDKFGKRFGLYLASLGGVMKTIREQVASLPGFEGAEKIPIGHLFGSEKLYGTHSNIPFRAVLINPAIASILPESNRGDASTMGPGGSDASVENVAMGMIGTTVHEFAHYRAGDHGYDFMATMQNLFGELTINDPVGFVRAIQAMNKVIKDYKDIYDDLNQKPDSERRLFGNPIKGSSETDGRADNRTDNTELSERSGGDRSNRRTDRKDTGQSPASREAEQQEDTSFDSEAPVTRRDFIKGGAALLAWAAGGKAMASTPTKAAAFKAVIAKKDTAAALDWIAANSNDPKFRTLATTVRNLLPPATTIRLRVLPQSGASDLGVTSVDRSKLRLLITLYESNNPALDGVTEATFIHEAIHAVLVARYDSIRSYGARWNKLGPRKADRAIDQYVAVWKEFSAMVDKDTGEKGGPSWLLIPASDPDEFITYALTSPELQAWLKTKPYKGGTLWSSLKEIFMRLLGYAKEPSWFDAAMTASNSLLDAAAQDAPDFGVSKELKRRMGNRADIGNTFAATSQATKDAVEAIELKNRMSPKYKGGGGWNVKDNKLSIGARIDYNGREYRVVSRKDDLVNRQSVKLSPLTAPFGLTDWVRSDTLKRMPFGPRQAEISFDSEAPALPGPGEALDPASVPNFDPRYQRTTWFGAFAGWTAGVDRAGLYVAAKAEDFANAFPRAANMARYFDWQFGLPKSLINSWTYTKLKSNPPKHEANALAAVMQNMPEADQQSIMDYLDDKTTKIAPNAKLLADNFKVAFRQLVRDYVSFATMKDDARDALRTKIDTAKISDLLIYVRDQKEVGSSGMSTVPIGHFLSDNRNSIDRANVFGLPNALEGRFFRIMEKLPTGPQGEMRSYVSGFVHEALAGQHQAGSNETIDRMTGWFLKGPDPTTTGHLIFTSNVSYAEANRYSKLATHGSAMRNTVDKLGRIVSSERFAQGTIKFGQEAGLVYDSREALAKDHPRMGINAPTVLTIRNVGDIDSLSYLEQNKLRQSDQWVHIPETSRAYGTMAGKYVNGSVWSALQDIHHNQPVINIPAYNTVIRWFKKAKTVFSPGTHIVNIGSNLSWMYLHDIPANSVGEGVRLYYKALVHPERLTTPEQELYGAFVASGAMIADHSSVELRAILSEASVEALGKKPSLWGDTEAMAMYERAKAEAIGKFVIKWGTKGKDAALWLDNFAQELYAAEDNAFRLAAFMSKASSLQAAKGGAKLTKDELMEAGKAAAEEFLDYNIHARAINAMKQTILPFISWPYRAIPAFMTLAIRKPWKVAGLVSALALIDAMAVAMTGGDEEDKRKRKALPTYMNDRLFGFGPHMYIQVPGLGTSNKPVYFKLGGFVPLGDLIQSDGRNPVLGQKWFPAQFTPNGPLISALGATVFNVDPFTGQKINKDTDTQMDALKKRAMYMQGQMAPPPLDVKKLVRAKERIWDDKRGPLGHEFSAAMEMGSLVGIRLVQIDVAEAAFTQSRAVKAIEMEYKKELASVTREALRFPNRKPAELTETKAAIKGRMKAEIERVKNKGD